MAASPPVQDRVGPRGQHPGQVGGQPAAGDVGVGVHVAACGQGQAVAGVDAGRGQQRGAQGPGELGELGRQVQPSPVQYPPDQGETVGVQA